MADHSVNQPFAESLLHKMGLLRIAIVMFASVFIASTAMHPLSDKFINHINSKKTTWTAGRNFPPNTPMKYLKKLASVQEDINADTLPRIKHADSTDLPDSFDPRVKWPYCPSLSEIRDQGSCGSSWALAAVEVMTDRVCIYSNGTKQFHFSAEDLLSCSSNSGDCEKGKPLRAWQHWETNGIVSGGNYNSSQGCKPYSFPPCEHLKPSEGNSGKMPCVKNVERPKCVRTCEKNYHIKYNKDKLYGKRIYGVELEIYIKAELMKNGPIQAVFWLYADFFNYKTGVYQYSGGDFIGLHSVKLMGWGVENGTKYWLAANSWNSDWGDHGFFKILRGEDHLRIISNLFAGEPLLTEG